MGVNSFSFKDREDWLQHRIGIGASEIGSVLGVGYKTPIQLWREKLGFDTPPDLSSNQRVQFGNDAEEPLRAMFRLMHPEYELSFTPYTILRQTDECTFLFDTPDGWLVEKETGRRGLYESKTATLISSADYNRWKYQVPQSYFAQICQGMFCGDFDFAVVWALLLNRDGDAELRAYNFERSECEWKIDEIKEKGAAFWNCVQTATMPPMPLTI